MRKHYLIISITRLIPLLIWVSLMWGCVRSWPIVCRHNAEICRIVAEEQGFETRKILGRNSEGIWHVQSQALINGEWEWLGTNGNEVFIDSQDYWFEPEIVKE